MAAIVQKLKLKIVYDSSLVKYKPNLNHFLAGDSEGVAQKIAAQVGIPKQNVHASVSPRGKVELVEELQVRVSDFIFCFVSLRINNFHVVLEFDQSLYS